MDVKVDFGAKRGDEAMYRLFFRFAETRDDVRLMMLEGSRTNPEVAKDALRDFDITYFVRSLAPYRADERWLDHFGRRIMMQKPESMALFPPECPGESYLMLFDDGQKIDLTLRELDELPDYLAASDGLCEVLLDKDGRIEAPLWGSEAAYRVRRPTCREYDDCCNEFWFVSTYVMKGLCRGDLLFAADHLERILRHELIRMLVWRTGDDTGYTRSFGKNGQRLPAYLSEQDWRRLEATFRMDGLPETLGALRTACDLFRDVSRDMARRLGCAYPPYDEAVTAYNRAMLDTYGLPDMVRGRDGGETDGRP